VAQAHESFGFESPQTLADSVDATAGDPLGRISQVTSLRAFKRLLFSGCWEDTETELAALRPPPGARILSITASGSRSLSLLAADPAEVLSVDLNPSQTALLELKRAAALVLDNYDQYAGFLGALPCPTRHRLRLAERVYEELPATSREYWRSQSRRVARGVVDAGRQDRIIAHLHPFASLLYPAAEMAPMFEMDDLERQAAYFDEHVDTANARAVVRLGGSKLILRMMYGRDLYDEAGYFSMGDMVFDNLAAHARVRLFRENYFLSRAVLRRFVDPRRFNSYYLQEASFADVQRRARRVRPITAPLEEVLAALPDGHVDSFSYSDIFDWIAPDDFDRLMRETLRVAKDGARICYRICLVPRRPRGSFARHFEEDAELARALLPRDRSCFYRDLYVATIRKAPRALA
jgi:S-adenosylmethionine-diacylglycerol 3-amino-3-carboxypropyl transferase